MRQLKITKSITNRESASLDKYLQEIGREDLITVEEEVELAQRIRNGYRPSPVKEGQLNITCKSPHELVVAFPEGCKEELRTVAELVSLISMRKSFYGHGNNVSRL